MTSIPRVKFPAYVVLAHKVTSDPEEWGTVDWFVSTGKDALESARYRAKRMLEKGLTHVTIREVTDPLYGGFFEKVEVSADA